MECTSNATTSVVWRTDQDIERLKELHRVADAKWNIVEATVFDLDLFGIESSSAGILRKHIENERQAIDNLEAALDEKNMSTIIKTARELKPPFAKAYLFFGDLPSPAG